MTREVNSRNGEAPERTVNLFIRFEAGDLFILFGLIHIDSTEEANAILSSAAIAIQDGWIYLDCGDCGVFTHGEGDDTADECGQWLPGANRDSFDELRSASIGVPAFLELAPKTAIFHPVWFSMQESRRGPGSRSWKLAGITSGYIDKPDGDQQLSSLHRLAG